MAEQEAKKPYRLGIVLSGGGARGFAHVGVLKALAEKGVYPDVISGSSAGAIAGALYCDGHSPDEILEVANKLRFMNVISVGFPRHGLFRLKGLTSIIRRRLKAKTFEALRIPLYVSATDFYNGKHKTFSSGELIRPVMASGAIPIIFRPVMIDGIAYVDSGVMDNLPTAPLENKCHRIIGVNANPVSTIDKLGTLPEIVDRTVRLTYRKNITQNREKCHLYIEPPQLSPYRLIDTSKAEEIAEIGYNYTRELLRYKMHLFDG